jgi:hypothetical protein
MQLSMLSFLAFVVRSAAVLLYLLPAGGFGAKRTSGQGAAAAEGEAAVIPGLCC